MAGCSCGHSAEDEVSGRVDSTSVLKPVPTVPAADIVEEHVATSEGCDSKKSDHFTVPEVGKLIDVAPHHTHIPTI